MNLHKSRPVERVRHSIKASKFYFIFVGLSCYLFVPEVLSHSTTASASEEEKKIARAA
jgi:hypothetical protein